MLLIKIFYKIDSLSSLSNKKVNVLVLNLDTANITYKLIKELDEGLSTVILMGLSEHIHILQLGASVSEIVNMSAVAVVDAQTKINKMITQLIGRLIEKTPTKVVIDCNGVGYEVNISLHTYSQIGDDEKIKLYTSPSSRRFTYTFGLIHQSKDRFFYY